MVFKNIGNFGKKISEYNSERRKKNMDKLRLEAEKAKQKELEIKEKVQEVEAKEVITDKNILGKFKELSVPDYIVFDYFKNDAAGSLKINESFDELTDDQRSMIIDNADKAAKKISEWVDAQN